MNKGDRVVIKGTNTIFDDKEGVLEEIIQDDTNTLCTIYVDFIPDEGKKIRQNFNISNVIPLDEHLIRESRESIKRHQRNKRVLLSNSSKLKESVVVGDLERSGEYDSEGNELSKQQVEFFKNSKVREGGKLLVCYHGSKTKDNFTTFKYDPANQTGTDYGKAFYFTTDKSKAQGYSVSSSKDSRLIQWEKDRQELKQKMKDSNYSQESCRAFLNYKVDGKYDLEDILDDEDYTHHTERLGHTKSVYLNIEKPYVADAKGESYFKVYPKYFKEAREGNYDGIIVYNVIDNPRGVSRPMNVFIAFEPNQIKAITNLNPTDKDDINEVLFEKR